MQYERLEETNRQTLAPAQQSRRSPQDVKERECRPRGYHGPQILPHEQFAARNGLRQQRIHRAVGEFAREEASPYAQGDEERIAPHEQKRHFVEIARGAGCAERTRQRKRHKQYKGKNQQREHVVPAPQFEQGQLHERADASHRAFHATPPFSKTSRKSRSRLPPPSPARRSTGPW